MPGAEEYGIHDAEDFGYLGIGEYESIESIHQKACFIVEYGELGAKLLAYYCSADIEVAKEALKNYYMGEYGSELEYAIHLFDECYLDTLPDSVQVYIDYEKFQRDIFRGDYFSLNVNGACHVFRVNYQEEE
jgi:antirestriction protein